MSLVALLANFEGYAARSTCFPGSEIRLPQGYTKGRRPETSAFSRSIASCGNNFARRGKSLSYDLAVTRDSRRANPLGHRGLIWAKTLGSLGVSRRLGYRVLRALLRSQQAGLTDSAERDHLRLFV